jgi:hypothetical protein
MDNLKNKSAVIAGCLKNSEAHLSAIFNNLNLIQNLYDKVCFIFVENDSTDQTKSLLNLWGANKKDFNFLNLDGLDVYEKNRTVRLEIARNAYIDLLNKRTDLHSYDHLYIIDMDDKATYPLDYKALLNSINFLNHNPKISGIFANQPNGYYDLWALRHPIYCPFDFWHEILFENLLTEDLFSAFNSIFSKVVHSIPSDAKPIQVNSAFGGLGIYKIPHVIRNKSKYIGHSYKFFNTNKFNFCKLQTCEHVSFNLGLIAQGGELYIMPNLINSMDTSNINPQAVSSILIK